MSNVHSFLHEVLLSCSLEKAFDVMTRIGMFAASIVKLTHLKSSASYRRLTTSACFAGALPSELFPQFARKLRYDDSFTTASLIASL